MYEDKDRYYKEHGLNGADKSLYCRIKCYISFMLVSFCLFPVNLCKPEISDE